MMVVVRMRLFLSASLVAPAFKRPTVESTVIPLLPGMLHCLAKDYQSQVDRQDDEPKQQR